MSDDQVEKFRVAAQAIVETLEAALSSFGRGKLNNKSLNSLPTIAPKLSEFALKSLRASINRLNTSTADELSDVLIASLLPASRSDSFSIKLHHLSLLVAAQRVSNATAQLEILNAGLKAKEGVEGRFNRAEQRKAREGVLRGLLDSIIHELRILKKEEAEDLGIPSTPPATGFGGRPSSSRNGNRSHNGEEEEEDEDETEEDELQGLKQKIKESTMPEETRKLCLKEWKRLIQIPSMSPEHGKARDYLDWMLSLPWSKSSFDLPNSSKIDKDFLERAKKQLEDDHFGIENVKIRLLQYLAVLRLKHEKWEEEEQVLQKKEQQEDHQQQQTKNDDKDSKAVVLRSDLSSPTKADSDGGSAAQKTPLPTSPKRKVRQFRDKGPILCLV